MNNKTEKSSSQTNISEKWVDQYKSEIQSYLYRRLTNSRLEADDVIQETFLRLIRKTDVDLIKNPRAYLYKIASNVIHEFELKNQHHCELTDQEQLNLMESPTTGVDRVEHYSSLKKILKKLPKTQLKVLIAIKRDGKSYGEVAKELDLSSETVRRYAFLAALHCRKHGWI